MALLAELNCPRPETITVSTPGEAIEVLKNSKHKIIMKATAVLDDVGRNDMTQYPIDGESAPYSKTRERLKIGLSVPLSPKTPYIMQQFVQGTEWCTHATVVDNKLKAFACCPSSDMLMHYEDGTRTIAGKLAEKWTLKFLDAWAHSHRGQKEPFTGHFSMVSGFVGLSLKVILSTDALSPGLYLHSRPHALSHRMQPQSAHSDLSFGFEQIFCFSLHRCIQPFSTCHTYGCLVDESVDRARSASSHLTAIHPSSQLAALVYRACQSGSYQLLAYTYADTCFRSNIHVVRPSSFLRPLSHSVACFVGTPACEEENKVVTC